MKAITANFIFAKTAYLLVLTTALIASNSMADTIYKWTDAKGGVHYSQTMPEASKDTKMLNVRAGSSVTTKSSNTTATSDADSATPEQQELNETKDKLKAEQKARKKEQCAQLKADMENLNLGGRIYETTADGERKYLTGSEIDSRQVKVRNLYSQKCSGIN